MKKLKSLLSGFLVLILLLLSVFSTLAVSKVDCTKKISEELLKAIEDGEQDIVSCYVFLNECDKYPIELNLKKKHNINMEDYENPERYYAEIAPNILVGNKKVKEFINDDVVLLEEISLNNDRSDLSLNVRKKINKALTENMDNYISCYRKEVSNVVGNYVDNFVLENEKFIEEIIVQPQGGEFIIAKIKSENITKISKSSLVNSISLYEELELVPMSWSATTVTHSDDITGLGSDLYRNGYDGSGVNVGVIECNNTRFDENHYSLSDADINYVNLPNLAEPTVSDHTTNVCALICGKKVTIDGKVFGGPTPEATVYQTGIMSYSDLYDAIELLANEYNVKVINISFGVVGGVTPYYNEIERIVDNLIENLRVCIVLASGNSNSNDGNFITSPGNSFNSIVVGNLITQYYNDIQLSPPYTVNSNSSYNEVSYLPCKPDVVAPGSGLNIATSATTKGPELFGTSYAAPIVTGIVAQLLQECGTSVINPNAIKNHLICGADSNLITGDTIDYGMLKEKSGAGLVNAVNSYYVMTRGLLNNYYGAYTYRETAPTEYETISTLYLEEGERIRTALSFEKEENIDIVSAYGNNIDIRLVSEDDASYCVASESTVNNVELIDTEILETGTYSLQIRFTNSILEEDGNEELHYWVSWRIYEE